MLSRSRILPAAATLLLLGAAATTLRAQPPTTAPEQAVSGNPAATNPARDQALDQLLSERGDPAALERAIANARAKQVPEQAILEARFLYHVDAGDDPAIAALLPEFLKRKENFHLDDSAIFATEDDFLAVTEFVSAIAALQRNERNAFKQHITEAFWLSPRQASAFAPHIERLRLAEAMAKLRLDLSLTLPPLDPHGKPTTLASIAKDKKAILIHFWSPLSRESLASLPDFTTTTKALATANIPTLSILLPDPDPNTPANAAKIATDTQPPPLTLWLRDHPTTPLTRTLRIQQPSTMVLVAPDGRILFNGDPVDDTLWKTISSIAPGFSRPPIQLHPPHD